MADIKTRKLTREEKVELLAGNLCKLVGIAPVEAYDGGANWFMFANDAEKLITDLESRGFQVWDWIDVKVEPEGGKDVD